MSPIPSHAGARAASSPSDGQRAGPSGRALFEASADLLAAARAVAANADAPSSDAALRPALACVEAALEALAEAAEQIAEDHSPEWPAEWVTRPMAAGRFDALAHALRSATVACSAARRVADGG